MILAEMLEYTASQYLDDRQDLIDGPPDELWSDAFLIRQFNHAASILARRAWVIVDVGNKTAGVLTLVTDKATYSLHPAVLRVYTDGFTISTEELPIPRYTDGQLRGEPLHPWISDAWQFDIDRASTTTAGPTIGIATDAGYRLVRVFPTPSTSENGVRINLKVARLPVCELELGKDKEELETPREFDMAICEYAAGKALSLPNAGGPGKAAGRLLLDGFDRVVREARQERERAERAPGRFGYASTTARL